MASRKTAVKNVQHEQVIHIKRFRSLYFLPSSIRYEKNVNQFAWWRSCLETYEWNLTFHAWKYDDCTTDMSNEHSFRNTHRMIKISIRIFFVCCYVAHIKSESTIFFSPVWHCFISFHTYGNTMWQMCKTCEARRRDGEKVQPFTSTTIKTQCHKYINGGNGAIKNVKIIWIDSRAPPRASREFQFLPLIFSLVGTVFLLARACRSPHKMLYQYLLNIQYLWKAPAESTWATNCASSSQSISLAHRLAYRLTHHLSHRNTGSLLRKKNRSQITQEYLIS